jgi:hypothetical protein
MKVRTPWTSVLFAGKATAGSVLEGELVSDRHPRRGSHRDRAVGGRESSARGVGRDRARAHGITGHDEVVTAVDAGLDALASAGLG